MAHSHMWHDRDSFGRETWLLHLRKCHDVSTHSWRGAAPMVIHYHHIHTHMPLCNKTHSCTWHDSFISIHLRDMNHFTYFTPHHPWGPSARIFWGELGTVRWHRPRLPTPISATTFRKNSGYHSQKWLRTRPQVVERLGNVRVLSHELLDVPQLCACVCWGLKTLGNQFVQGNFQVCNPTIPSFVTFQVWKANLIVYSSSQVYQPKKIPCGHWYVCKKWTTAKQRKRQT